MTTKNRIGHRETELLERVRLAKGHSAEEWLTSPSGQEAVQMARVRDALEEAVHGWLRRVPTLSPPAPDLERIAALRKVLRETDGEP